GAGGGVLRRDAGNEAAATGALGAGRPAAIRSAGNGRGNDALHIRRQTVDAGGDSTVRGQTTNPVRRGWILPLETDAKERRADDRILRDGTTRFLRGAGDRVVGGARALGTRPGERSGGRGAAGRAGEIEDPS